MSTFYKDWHRVVVQSSDTSTSVHGLLERLGAEYIREEIMKSMVIYYVSDPLVYNVILIKYSSTAIPVSDQLLGYIEKWSTASAGFWNVKSYE